MDASIVKIEPQSGGAAKLFATVGHMLGWDVIGEEKRAKSRAKIAIIEAEAAREVARINAESDFELQFYMHEKEMRKMNNAKSVVSVAERYLSDENQVSSEPVKQDWLNRFFSIVEEISDESMQEMWGRILAGEVKTPNSYSLRTMELLRNISKDEAEVFVKASSFFVMTDFICTEEEFISLRESLLLCEVGFLNAEALTKQWIVSPHSKYEIAIDRDTLLILVNESDKKIDCSTSMKQLSKAGKEIYSIIITESGKREDFYNNLARIFKQKGISKVTKHKIIDFDNGCRSLTFGTELSA